MEKFRKMFEKSMSKAKAEKSIKEFSSIYSGEDDLAKYEFAQEWLDDNEGLEDYIMKKSGTDSAADWLAYN